ncbi:MAG: M48 family metallopeptidase [Solirubrobacteraceae bacterium]
MSARRGIEAVGSLLLAAAVAEGSARLLTPPGPTRVPLAVDLGAYFSAEELRRGRRYARPQRALALSRGSLKLGALAALVRYRSRAPGAPHASHRPYLSATAGASGLAVGLTALTLPLSALARRRAVKVGLVTQSWRGWALDLLKAGAIESVMAGATGAAMIAVTRRWPTTWWAPAAGASVVFGALLAAGAPVILDPVFNDFTPLHEGDTRADVLELAAAAGVKVGQVLSVDASRRSTAANAYVTGLGPTKRVVLFDTLLDRYPPEQVRVVVAHELAHVRHRDVARSVLFAALSAPALALAVQRLSWWLSEERGTPASLPALALAMGLASAPLGLSGNRLSRAVERRADEFAFDLSGEHEAFVRFEREIALQNVADIDPPRWVARLLASHPPTAQRIGAALAAAGSVGGRPSSPPAADPRTRAGS